MTRYQQYIMPVLCLIVVLAVWEFSVQFFGIDLYVLPAPSDIAKAIGSEFGTLWMHSMVTLQEAVIGLLIATVLAVLIAILMDLNRTFRHSVFPYLVVSQTVPVMVLGPLFTMWLGFGLAPKILMVVFMCFSPSQSPFPMHFSTSTATKSICCAVLARICCSNIYM